jgi:hypothetical protein
MPLTVVPDQDTSTAARLTALQKLFYQIVALLQTQDTDPDDAGRTFRDRVAEALLDAGLIFEAAAAPIEQTLFETGFLIGGSWVRSKFVLTPLGRACLKA